MNGPKHNRDKLKLKNLSFCSVTIHNLLSHKSSPTKSSILPLILGMLATVAYVVLTNNHPWTCKCCFTMTCMFLQSIKLRNQCLFFLSNLIVNFTSYLGYLPFKINNYFNPWKLNSPNILEHLIGFSFFSFDFFW